MSIKPTIFERLVEGGGVGQLRSCHEVVASCVHDQHHATFNAVLMDHV